MLNLKASSSQHTTLSDARSQWECMPLSGVQAQKKILSAETLPVKPVWEDEQRPGRLWERLEAPREERAHLLVPEVNPKRDGGKDEYEIRGYNVSNNVSKLNKKGLMQNRRRKKELEEKGDPFNVHPSHLQLHLHGWLCYSSHSVWCSFLSESRHADQMKHWIQTVRNSESCPASLIFL